jgi:uncharacterized protein YutE (UPF0331/DUF86 family)
MSPLDAAIIRRKMQLISQNLRHLEEVQRIGFERYCQSVFERKAAERLLQELIEAAIDINLYILAASGAGVPDESYQSFIRLGSTRVLDEELARKLAPAAGLRNRLVHEYQDIDDARVWESIQNAQDLFPHYLKAIEGFLERTEVSS